MAFSIAKMRSIFDVRSAASGMSPIRVETMICVSNSLNEPRATERKFANSFLLLRAAPSAMLLGTETALLLIWDTSPNRSSLGKVPVTT